MNITPITDPGKNPCMSRRHRGQVLVAYAPIAVVMVSKGMSEGRNNMSGVEAKVLARPGLPRERREPPQLPGPAPSMGQRRVARTSQQVAPVVLASRGSEASSQPRAREKYSTPNEAVHDEVGDDSRLHAVAVKQRNDERRNEPALLSIYTIVAEADTTADRPRTKKIE